MLHMLALVGPVLHCCCIADADADADADAAAAAAADADADADPDAGPGVNRPAFPVQHTTFVDNLSMTDYSIV